jgi:hypothetical protein
LEQSYPGEVCECDEVQRNHGRKPGQFREGSKGRATLCAWSPTRRKHKKLTVTWPNVRSTHIVEDLSVARWATFWSREDEGSWPLVRGHPFAFYLEYLTVFLQPHLKERKEVSCIPHHHLPPNILLIKQCTSGNTAQPHSQTAHDSLFHL